ncbi:hypothetical protein ACRRTK_020753 [Alexandromys fortis]
MVLLKLETEPGQQLMANCWSEKGRFQHGKSGQGSRNGLLGAPSVTKQNHLCFNCTIC